MDEAAFSETLDPKRERQAAPCSNKVPSRFPKEYGNAAARYSGDATRQDEEATDSLRRRIDGPKNTEPHDQDQADQRQRVEADKEEGRPDSEWSADGRVAGKRHSPAVLVAEEGARDAGEDEEGPQHTKGWVESSL